MRTIRNSFGSLAIIGGLIGSLLFVHAQTVTKTIQSSAASLDDPNVNWASLSDVEVELKAIEATTPVAADALPFAGTFISAQHALDWPPLPGNIRNLPCWPLDTNLFLLSDLAINYSAKPKATRQMTAMAGNMMAMDLPAPGDGGGGDTNSYAPSGSGLTVDFGTNLWIANFALTSSNAVGALSNSSPDIYYEIQTRQSLTSTDGWVSAGFVYGSELTNWTSLVMTNVSLTNNAFFRIRSWIDSANVGIPDWWQLQYFGYVGIDPYAASPAGDGFDIFSKYQNGLAPTTFVTPPAPNDFVAVLSTNGADVLLSWNPAQGTVTGYVIERGVFDWRTYHYDYSQIGTVNSNTTTFTDVGGLAAGGGSDPVYELAAVYPGNNSSQTASSYLYYSPPPPPTPPTPVYNIYVAATLIRNATGRWQVMFTDLSANAQIIQLTWTDSNWNTTTQNISANSLTKNIYQIPDADVVNFMGDSLSVQGMDTSGDAGAVVQVGTLSDDAPYFVDGRQHLKQNLNFLIRAASLYRPFGVFIDGRLNQTSTNFEEFSFLHHDTDYYNTWVALDNLWPFTENYNLENYLVDPTRTDNPYGNTNFNFQINFATNMPAPPILSASPFGILQPGFLPVQGFYSIYPIQINNTNGLEWGVTLQNTQTVASLQSGLYNVFQLPYQDGIEIDFGSAPTGYPNTWLAPGYPIYYQSLPAGGSVTAQEPGYFVGAYASQCPAPTLQVTNYYFASLLNPNGDPMNLPSVSQQPFPLPIDDAFNVTNQTPSSIIGAVGQPMILGGWAKYAIKNGSTATGKYAYLGQYFVTNAPLLGTNGIATTNSAGILSPYGEFFPTQAGQAALVTMPDIDPPYEQGTGIVQIVSLNVDANHDGTMDLSYFGPDQTSPSKPYVFWANQNFDRWKYDWGDREYYMDDVLTNGPADCNVTDFFGNRVIPTTRDLEDFSRLWINGVTSNLLATLPPNSTVTLNWGDVGNPNPNNPTIDLFTAADADGGIGYLTNSTMAAHQIDPSYSPYIQRLGPGQSIQLNANYFGSTWRGNYFIWCGVTNGSGKLNLTFADGSGKVLGQASVYIQIVDIKQMYERWTVGENPTQAPASTAYIAENDLAPGEAKFQYTTPVTAGTPYILFVHGWNIVTWVKDRFAETAFKRLYWQGYQGRFGVFRWPTFANQPSVSLEGLHPRNFDASEFNAWRSSTGLLNLLTQLNAVYPGHVYLFAHSQGNIVAGEALRLAGINRVVNTYVATQAAIAAHAYDPTTPSRDPLANTPDCYAYYWTNGAPCYFNGVAGAGTYVNFFNTNDWALTLLWEPDQNLKPDATYSYQNPPGQFYEWLVPLYFPQDTYKIFAYCDDARSFALGAQANVKGAFYSGGQINQLDLSLPPYYFTGTHLYHSGQFRSDNAQFWPVWNRMLIKMALKEE